MLEEMRSTCLQPDVISYNTTISACEGLPDIAAELVADMRRTKIQVDVVTFNACITSCEQLRLKYITYKKYTYILHIYIYIYDIYIYLYIYYM